MLSLLGISDKRLRQLLPAFLPGKTWSGTGSGVKVAARREQRSDSGCVSHRSRSARRPTPTVTGQDASGYRDSSVGYRTQCGGLHQCHCDKEFFNSQNVFWAEGNHKRRTNNSKVPDNTDSTTGSVFELKSCACCGEKLDLVSDEPGYADVEEIADVAESEKSPNSEQLREYETQERLGILPPLQRRRVDSPTDRLVGLTIHCLILSILVMSMVLVRWLMAGLRFLLYLALHSAVYRGKVAPLREDSEEPITQDELRDATLFDSIGLRIVLLQYRPPRRRQAALEGPPPHTIETDHSGSSCRPSGGRSEAGHRGTATTTTNTTTTTRPARSLSGHSGVSQDLSHIFSSSNT